MMRTAMRLWMETKRCGYQPRSFPDEADRSAQRIMTGMTNHDRNDEDWGLLHTYIQNVFPLLRTESSSVSPPADVVVGNERVVDDSNDGSNDTNDDGIEHRKWSNFVEKH